MNAISELLVTGIYGVLLGCVTLFKTKSWIKEMDGRSMHDPWCLQSKCMCVWGGWMLRVCITCLWNGAITKPLLSWIFLPGRVPGLFTVLLQCLYLDTALLKLQNTKKLFGVKNNNIAWAVRANSEQKTQRDQKAQLPVLKSLEQKQGNVSAFCTQSHLEVVRLPRPSLRDPQPR